VSRPEVGRVIPGGLLVIEVLDIIYNNI